jgi:hypothetical protein
MIDNRLGAAKVKKLVIQVLTTRTQEIDCDECLEMLDRFVEMTLQGREAAEALPLVQQHLQQCDCCREEFEALLSVLRNLD